MRENINTDREKSEIDNHGQQAFAVQRKDFWVSVLVAVLVIEFFITVAALCYGIITSPPRHTEEAFRLVFPWMGWLASILIAPAVIVGLIHLVTGQERWAHTQSEREEAWASHLPKRMYRLYRLIKDAPLFMVSLAFIALGATLFTIDGALTVIGDIARSLIPYTPYFIGGSVGFVTVIAILLALFRYKNNKLQAEYAFRREVLEKTGVILIDKKSQAILPSKSRADAYSVARFIDVGSAGDIGESGQMKALPGVEESSDHDPDRLRQ